MLCLPFLYTNSFGAGSLSVRRAKEITGTRTVEEHRHTDPQNNKNAKGLQKSPTYIGLLPDPFRQDALEAIAAPVLVRLRANTSVCSILLSFPHEISNSDPRIKFY